MRDIVDKNTDYDSSVIFTIIQSAYEKLLASAPADTSGISAAGNNSESSSSQNHKRSSVAEKNSGRQSAQESSSSANKDHNSDKRNSTRKEESKRERTTESYSGSNISSFTTEQLREMVQKFGVFMCNNL